MFAHNTVRLTGNVGGDPEIRHFDGGKVKANFSIAIYAGKDRPSEWFDVECWGFAAERAAEGVSKGTRVSLAGSLKQERWQDRATGGNRSKIVVNAESVEIIAKRAASAESQGDQSAEGGYDDIPF